MFTQICSAKKSRYSFKYMILDFVICQLMGDAVSIKPEQPSLVCCLCDRLFKHWQSSRQLCRSPSVWFVDHRMCPKDVVVQGFQDVVDILQAVGNLLSTPVGHALPQLCKVALAGHSPPQELSLTQEPIQIKDTHCCFKICKRTQTISILYPY